MYPHGYIGMTTNPTLADWSGSSLDEFGDDEEQDDTTNADDDQEAGE